MSATDQSKESTPINCQIELVSFMSHFEGRADELLVQYENARLQNERETHNTVVHALEKANTSLQYLIEHVSGFKELLEKIKDKDPAPFGDIDLIAMSGSKGDFLPIRRLGPLEASGVITVGINNDEIIITITEWSPNHELEFYSRLKKIQFKYLDSKSLREELERYCSPMRLLEALLLKRH